MKLIRTPISSNLNYFGRLTAGLAPIVSMLLACAVSPHDRKDVEALVNGPNPPTFATYTIASQQMHYASVGTPGKRPILFIHGTPGSWEVFAVYLADERLRRDTWMIAVDRVGFGKSKAGRVVTSLQAQAALLAPVIRMSADRLKALVVGHSLGGPIAVRLAIDFPDLVAGLILVAPSLDPELEQPRWYNRMADSMLINWALPKPLRLANQEIMPLASELHQMLPHWQCIDLPVVVIQGMQDELVAPENADFVERILDRRAKIVRIPEAGHFVLWKQPDVVMAEILSMMQQIQHHSKRYSHR